MFTKIIAIVFALFTAASLAACTPTAATPSKPAEATGSWNSPEPAVFTAELKNDTINIYWHPTRSSQGLFWSGTLPTKTLTDGQTFVSHGNRDMLDRSIYGSSELDKPFKVVGEEIHFEFTIAQTSHQIALTRFQ